MIKMDQDCKEGNVDFSVMCRTCAFCFDPTILRDITPPVRDMLFFCAGIQVDVMGALPTRLCGTCYSRADAASQFKLQCSRAEEKLINLAQLKLGTVITSTPNYVTEHDKSPARISRSPLSELDVPLTPMRCDSALNIILDQKADDWIECLGLQGDEEKISTRKSLSHIPSSGKNYIKSEPDIINTDSILSFLNHGDSASKLGDNVEDLSLLSFSTPLKRETPRGDEPDLSREIQQIDVDKFFHPILINIKSNDDEKLVENLDKYTDCDIFDLNNSVDAQTTSVNLEDFKRKVVKVNLTDFMKINVDRKKIEENIKKYGYVRCKFCTKKLDCENSLVDHMVKKHSLKFSEITDFVRLVAPEEKIVGILKKEGTINCKFCPVVCNSVDRFHSHLRRKHYYKCEKIIAKSKVVYICDYCQRRFTIKKYLRTHINTQHIMKSVREWKCKKCKKILNNLTSYKSHVKIHQIKVPNQSNPICENQNNSLSEKGNVEHLCSVCGKNFTTKSNLKEHVKRHYSTPTEPCNICRKCFKLPRDLKHHMKIHEKTHECLICKKMFSRPDHLAAHMKVHKGERTYKCAECGECFMWNKELKKHILDVHIMNRA